MPRFEYAPAPESRSVVDIRPSYGLFIDGEFVESAGGVGVQDDQPGHRGGARRGHRGERRRRRPRRRGGPHGIRAASGAGCPAPTAASTSSASPASCRSGPASSPSWRRSTTASRSRSRRDVDVPLAAAHFFYHAGWADKLEYAGLGTADAATPDRRRRPGHPVELPAAHAVVEDRAGAGRGQHRRPQAGRDHAADRAAVRRGLPAGRPARRASSTSSPAPATTGQRLVDHPGVDKVAFTGSTEVGKAIARTIAGTRKRATLELGGKAANIVFDDAPIDQAVEGIVNGIFFNQGHVCCAGSRLLVQESVADEVDRGSSGGCTTLRVGDPLDKNTDVGAINSAAQLDRIRELTDVGEAEGAERWSPPCDLPEPRVLVRPNGVHRRRPDAPHRPGGDLRAGPVGADLPHPAGGGRQGQQHAVRPVRRRLDREGLAHPLDGRPAARRRGLGQHLQQVRPDLAVRRLQGVRLRPRGRPPRPGGLRHDRRRPSEPHGTASRRADAAARRPQDLQALHRRRLPAQRVRAAPTRSSATPKGRFLANAAHGLAQGRPRRGRRRPRRRSPAGPARRRTTAARCSTASPR